MRKTKLKGPWIGELISKDSSKGLSKFRRLTEGSFAESTLSNRINPSRFYIFYVVSFFVILVFLARLFGLTVISGSENRILSEGNRIRLIESETERGKILDRTGAVLARSERIYFLKKDSLTTQISSTQASELQDLGLAGENFKGELGEIKQEVRRKYELLEAGAHVLGYTSKVQKEDIGKDTNLNAIQSVGRLGLEQTYNDFLVGKPGKKLVEVDTFGKKIAILKEEESESGQNIHTTLDKDLQKITFDSLSKQTEKTGTKRGAVVVQKVQTGEVLALVSNPSFDPENIGRSVSDLNTPFFNRATQGSYPPGSVFKIVSALAGLKSGQISADTEIEDVGEFELGGSKFSNWFYTQYGKKDGTIKIEKAIARSNDIFFYRLAEKVGLGAIREMAKKLGLGQKTGIDLPSEAVGLVPDEVWKQATFNDSWYLGDTLHLGIGQGFMLTSPIQMNAVTSFVASGKLTKPFLVSKIEGEGREFKFAENVRNEDIVDSQYLETVRSGMRDACKIGGTGAPFFNAAYSVGCKTGTAEKALGNPHAWFTVYAPFENPQIAVTVLVEDGGEGSSVAAPVAKEIVDWWIANRAR